LERKGLVYTVHGKGTFVKLPDTWEMIEQGIPFSTYDLLHKAGVKIGKINQTIRARNAGKEIGDILKVPCETALIVEV
jgi:DNA-binding GntR family transcriptional regulator